MANTPNLEMPEIATSQASKNITHNESLRILDAAVQLGIVDKDLTTAPASPTNGDVHIIASTGGAWSTFTTGDIAHFVSGNGWIAVTPKEGWTGWVKDESQFYSYTSTGVWDTTSNMGKFFSSNIFTSTGQLVYSDPTALATALTVGTTGQHLEVVSGLPVWKGQNKVRTEVSTATFSPSAGTYYMGVVHTSTAAVGITLASGIEGFEQIIKDEADNAGTNNITVSAPAGQLIDKATSKVLSTNGGVLRLKFLDDVYRIIGE